MSIHEGPATPMELPRDPDSVTRSLGLGPHQWTIRRIMVVILILAPLLALSRFPFAFGLVVTIALIALFVVDSVRRLRFGRIAWLLCGYPLLPLALLYLQYGLLIRKVIRRSSVTVLDGAFAFSDIGGFLCLIAYVGCVSIVAGSLASQSFPELKRAAWRVVRLMPLAWVALFAFALWDPFGALARLFH